MQTYPLEGQCAPVTGASSGIGAAIAVALGAAGAKVVVNYRGSQTDAEAVAGRIEQSGTLALCVQADVSREADVQTMFRAAIESFGTIDILVNNAGIQKDAALHTLSLDDWRKVIDVNLTGQFLCAREAVREFMLDAQMLKPAWTTVLFGLRQDWSPQQLCDRLKDGMIPPAHLPAGVRSLSHETIYRAIYGMPAGQQHAELVKLLRNSKAGRRKAKGKRFTGLQNMVTIKQRPSAANLRLEPGHWEGDLIKGAFGRSAVGTLVDRFTRVTLLVKLDSAHAQEVRKAFQAMLSKLPPPMRLTLTHAP